MLPTVVNTDYPFKALKAVDGSSDFIANPILDEQCAV